MIRKRTESVVLLALCLDLYTIVPEHLFETERSPKLFEVDPFVHQ
jgi:hypothetical protein